MKKNLQIKSGCPLAPAFLLMGPALIYLVIGSTLRAHAQETVRMSLASAEAAEARRRAAATIGYYNLKLGPTGWRFGAGLTTEYNDNVVLRENNPESDLIFRPQINAQMLWPITDKNSLNLNLGGGYSAYVRHPELDRAFIAPGSELSFDLYLGDFWINLHDRFSISEDSYQDPTVTGTGNYARLENATGLSATWDLNKVIVRGGYDHVLYLALSGNNGQPDGESDLVSSSVGYALGQGRLAGIELGGGLLHYTGTNVFFKDAKQWNAGIFSEMQVSQHLHLHGSLGYTDYAPENRPGEPVTGDSTGIYAQIDIQHRLNQFVDYTLSGGRSINFAFYGGSVDLTYARLVASWRMVRKIGIDTTLEYEHGSQVSFFGETFDRLGAGISFSRRITEKLTGALGYQFYRRTSDVAGRDYLANIVSLSLNYTF